MTRVCLTILGEAAIIARFMANVSQEPMSGCWLWTASLSHDYGMFRIRGAQERAHRVSWMLHKGAIPHGLHVLHDCDNPACVNPAHLFVGTNADNVADRVAKGRSGWKARRGDEHPMRKLNADTVRSIRRRLLGGERQSAIASELGVSRTTICEIASGRKWGSVE